MSDEEFTTSIRKFLKHLGVTGHQLIEDELRKNWKDLNFAPCIIEKKIKLKKELSVICVRDQNKKIYIYYKIGMGKIF